MEPPERLERALSEDGQQISRLALNENGQTIIANIDPDQTWHRSSYAKAYADELLSSYEGAILLERRYKQDPSLPVNTEIVIGGSSVSHLGCGVFAHEHTKGIDRDSDEHPTTATTIEMRTFARKCLKAVQKKKFAVGTGQPGIGKTRGSLYFALQILLWRGSVVLRVGYKTNQVFLFLPDSSGTYTVWENNAADWTNSRFAANKKVFALVDPPEHSHYKREAACMVLEFASNNNERHLRNAHKDGVVLLSDLPSLSEILCLERILWKTESSSIDLPTTENRHDELLKRCFLVGCVPRAVFDEGEFEDQLDAVKNGIRNMAAEMGVEFILDVYNGGRTQVEKSMCAFPSRYFLIRPKDSGRRKSVARLNSISIYYLRENLNERLQGFTGAVAFEFEDICPVFLKGGLWYGELFPPRKVVVGTSLQHTTELIDHNTELLRWGQTGNIVRASNCYPILDFAISKTSWFNAKVGYSDVKVSLSAFVSLMRYLNFAAVNGAEFTVTVSPPPQILLTMVRNSDIERFTFDRKMARMYESLDVNRVEQIFKGLVTVRFFNTKAWAPRDVLEERTRVTGDILNEIASRQTVAAESDIDEDD